MRDCDVSSSSEKTEVTEAGLNTEEQSNRDKQRLTGPDRLAAERGARAIPAAGLMIVHIVPKAVR
jgi:hypothetical protein